MRLVLLLLLGLLVTAPAAATPEDPAPAAVSAGRHLSGDLSGDVVVPSRPLHARGSAHTYPGSKIRYYETIPAKWQWSLDRAIAHWNGSGGDIRFVKVASRDRAQLTIGYGNTHGYDGLATLGPAPGAFVRLSPAYKDVDAHDPLMRVWVGRLFTHELGHSLGFGHTDGTCSLMVPVFDMGRCALLDEDRPGYYFQRWIDSALLRRFIDVYGGNGKRPAELGLIAPLPAPLEDLVYAGGRTEDAPVTIRWQVPARYPQGTRVLISRWPGPDCRLGQDAKYWEFDVPLGNGTWKDRDQLSGAWCYYARPANRYYAERPGRAQLVEPWAPVPDAPEVTYLGFDRDLGHRFSHQLPDGMRLEVMRSHDDPTTCPTTYDETRAESVYRPEDFEVWPDAARECLSFFLVTDWGTVSPATPIQVEVPAPTTVPTVGTVEPASETSSYPSVDAALGDDRYELGVAVLPGPCPAQPPADVDGWWDGSEVSPGHWWLYPEGAGTSCALFAAIDTDFSWGFVVAGPVVMREFTG